MNETDVDNLLSSLSISENDMIDHLAPYISQCVSKDSPEGQLWRRQRFKNLLHMIALLYAKQLKLGRRERSGELVKDMYETAYSNSKFDGYDATGRYVTYLYGDKVLKLMGIGNYRSKSYVVEKAIEIIKPKTMCEIGCGKGRHVFYFAHKFPQTQFTGIDFSSNAIALAQNAQKRDDIDLGLPEKPGLLNAEELKRIRSVEFKVGDASNLSNVDDNAFEVVYTISALEQMSHILPDVLKEIHRVSSKYVIFCEPFWDANDFLGRVYLNAGNYFRAKISQLENAGFETLNYLDCVPLKPSFKDTIFIAKVKK